MIGKRTISYAIILCMLTMAVPAMHFNQAFANQSETVLQRTLAGTIVKVRQNYYIRSKLGDAPSEIFTIRNPVAGTLDVLVASKKEVIIDVRIISGDNVAIEKIDGQEYPGAR